MTSQWIVGSLAAGFLLTLGCGKGNFEDYNRLGGLRVLAMKADHPEVAPGTAVLITPVVSDLAVKGRVLNWVATGCADPGIAYGSEPSCDSAVDRVDLGTGVLTPALVGPAYTQAIDPISVTVPVTILEGRTSIDQANGVSYLVTYVITAADGSRIQAFKRLVVSTRTQKNTNPTILDIFGDRKTMISLPVVPTLISVSLPEEAAENYGSITSDGVRINQKETLLVTWFISDGEFDQMRVVGTSENLYSPPQVLPTDHSVVIVAVVRDGRGGEDFRIMSY